MPLFRYIEPGIVKSGGKLSSDDENIGWSVLLLGSLLFLNIWYAQPARQFSRIRGSDGLKRFKGRPQGSSGLQDPFPRVSRMRDRCPAALEDPSPPRPPPPALFTRFLSFSSYRHFERTSGWMIEEGNFIRAFLASENSTFPIDSTNILASISFVLFRSCRELRKTNGERDEENTFSRCRTIGALCRGCKSIDPLKSTISGFVREFRMLLIHFFFSVCSSLYLLVLRSWHVRECNISTALPEMEGYHGTWRHCYGVWFMAPLLSVSQSWFMINLNHICIKCYITFAMVNVSQRKLRSMKNLSNIAFLKICLVFCY